MARAKRASAPKPEGGLAVPPTVLMAPALMNGAPYNPRKITPERLEGLKASIRAHGFVENVVIQKRSPRYGERVILGGHQRLRALREICIEEALDVPEVPTVLLDVDDRTAKRVNLALNAPRGENDPRLLAEVLTDIQTDSVITPEEMGEIGFGQDEIARYLRISEPPKLPDIDDAPSFGSSVTLSLSFRDTRERDATRIKLEELAKVEKKTTGEVVFSLLGAAKR